MAIKDIRLQNFRSYKDEFFELSPGVNIIVGPNASGKTNLLEAVLVLARGSSYRARDAELVAHGTDWARLDTHDPEGNLRTLKLQRSSPGVCKKSFEIDQKNYLRLSQQKSLPLVLFEPNHLTLLSGSPELRRSYLDELLEQTSPHFGTTRRQYRRVLAQRNALLKRGSQFGIKTITDQIFIWNVRLSELAGKIVRERLALIKQLNSRSSKVYGEISSSEATVELNYLSTLSAHHPDTDFFEQYESALIHRFEHTLERDSLLGFTTAGPHRDDFQILLNGHLSQESASRGEVRTVVLMLKIIELQMVKSAHDLSPILLLDDVFSELDETRRLALASFLLDYQTFITTTDADMITTRINKRVSKIITLAN